MTTNFKHNLDFSSDDPPLKGFQEVVFSVSNLEKMVDLFERVCGWKVISRQDGNDDLKKLWQLGKSVKIEEVLMQNEGDVEGFLRLVKFKNVEQEQIRSATQAWDSGGIFDINMRTKDMKATYREFQNEGWNGYADPLRYTFGIYDVSEVLLKGPDGITIAVMERFAPPLEGFDEMKKTSRIFNSSVIAKNMEETHDFYINKLGFKMFFQSPGNSRDGTHNVLGFPQNLNKDIRVPIDIVRPDIDNYGSIEYLEPKEIKGKDCSHLAKPPNLGILMHRFPVKSAENYANNLIKKGVEINSPIQTLEIQPYGKMKIFSILSPNGVWLEFIELIG